MFLLYKDVTANLRLTAPWLTSTSDIVYKRVITLSQMRLYKGI